MESQSYQRRKNRWHNNEKPTRYRLDPTAQGCRRRVKAREEANGLAAKVEK